MIEPPTGLSLLIVILLLLVVALGGWWIRRLQRALEDTRRARDALLTEGNPAEDRTDPPRADWSPELDALPIPVCVLSPDGAPERVNRAFMEWHGGPNNDGLPELSSALGRIRLFAAGCSLESTLTGDGEEMSEALELSDSHGLACWFVCRIVSADGGATSPRWCLLLPYSRSGQGSDLASVFDEAPIGVALVDADRRISAANPTLAELTGLPRDRLIGKELAEFVHEPDRAALGRMLDGDGVENASDREAELRLGSVGRTFVSAFARDELDHAGGPARASTLVYMIDISSRQILEERMIQSQKMQAVGQLAGGIAHDFNNLLTAMTGFCDLLLLRHRSGDPSFTDIMQIKQNANRAANLVRQLLAFSRQQTLIPRVIDVTETLADLSHLLRRLIGEGIDLRINHGKGLKPVRVDQSQLEQVVVNLIVNARDALGGRGAIVMRTNNVFTDEEMRKREEVMPPGEYVLIEVNDSGAGIEEENLDRVFEPFFSTKDVGSGTGLGLSTVYGIVKQTSGFIFVESTIGEGTTFSIYLPAHDGTAVQGSEMAGTDHQFSRDLTGTGTILLVEDEDPVRLFAARALRGKGYGVIEARSGDNALAMLRDGTDPIDLLITDVMIPGMDGPTLIREAREILPEVPVICISGYSEDALRQRISEDIAIHFLSKPFSLQQLATKVKEIIQV
jgi:two-component system, cell cycle sensor histidine kinase and response regulator CckA